MLGISAGGDFLFHFDLNDLNLPTCKDCLQVMLLFNNFLPGGPQDYEVWEPMNDENQNNICYMGGVTEYMR